MDTFIVDITYWVDGKRVQNTHRVYQHFEESFNLKKTEIEFIKRLEARLSSEICYSRAWYNLIRDMVRFIKVFITDCLPDGLKSSLEAKLFVHPGSVPVLD